MTRDAADTLLHLSHLRNGQPEEQERSLNSLQSEWHPFLYSLLRKWAATSEDREDVVQTLWMKVWNSRANLQFSDTAAWKQYLKVVLLRTWLDSKQEVLQLQIEPEELAELSSTEVDVVAAVVFASLDNEAIQRASEELWLSAPEQNLRDRQLLAAQMFFGDGVPVETIAKVLSRPGSKLSRQQVDSWLETCWAILGWSHSELYFPNLKLLATILHLPEDRISANASDGVMQAAAQRLSLDQNCLEYLISKCLLPRKRAVDIRKWESDPELRRTFDSLHSFTKVMYHVTGNVGKFSCGSAMLMQHGLWRKLVFDYRYLNDLPLTDVVERIQPAAKIVGYDGITEANVTVLTSGGRLLKDLVKQLEVQRG